MCFEKLSGEFSDLSFSLVLQEISANEVNSVTSSGFNRYLASEVGPRNVTFCGMIIFFFPLSYHLTEMSKFASRSFSPLQLKGANQ